MKRSGSPSHCSEEAKKQKLEGVCGRELSGDSSLSKKSIQPNESSSSDSPLMQSTPNVGKVTSVTLGTPVIVTSEYSQLPSADKFSKNICDVINFENLPDSTGKYEKMSGLLQKVRSFRSRLEEEDDNDDDDENEDEDDDNDEDN